jgi:hypothetical protein
MKNVLLQAVVFIACVYAMISCGGKAQETDLKGHYKGRNLFVENPNGPDGIGFCVVEVKVNGRITTDEVNSAAFEIDFPSLGIKEGDPVEVELIHKKGCEPVVKNADVLH